jgi:fructosamine-3-kinase
VKDWIMGEGGASKITKIRPVGGGCINNASHYETDAGSFFVKTNRYVQYVSMQCMHIRMYVMYYI